MNDIVEQLFHVKTPSGAPLYGDIRWKAGLSDALGARLPAVIVCHGFKAFKDWGPFPAIGRALAQSGFVSLVFNFSHNGIGREFKKFSEPKKFSANTISLELTDVEAILNAISGGEIECPFIDSSRIGIIGHSRGGGIAIIKAREDERIKAVAGWSTVAYFNRYTEGQRKRWREKGFVQLPSVNPLSIYKLTTALLDDLEQNAARLDIVRAVKELRKPLLLVHGTGDIPVPIAEVKKLADVADRRNTEFVTLEGVGHMYGARHPYRKVSETMSKVLDLTTAWFHKNL